MSSRTMVATALLLGLSTLGAAPIGGTERERARWARHESVNGEAEAPSISPEALVTELAAYARDLGYDSVRVDEGALTLVKKDGTTAPLGSAGGLRDAGRAINRLRFDTERIVAMTRIDARAESFDTLNAHAASHLARLAYLDSATVKAQLGEWGFDTETFRWLEDATTDTQGFVVADGNGLVVTSFRGTSSRADVATDADTSQVEAAWAASATRKIHVHRGFDVALESVWKNFSAALDDAKKTVKAKKQTPSHFFAGHSLGGALSSVAALRALREGRIDAKRTQIYTNGAPRAGDEAFRATFSPLAPRAFRMVNSSFVATDIVTRLPLKSMGYRHAGNLVLYSDSEHVVVPWVEAGTRAPLDQAMDEEGTIPRDPEDEELEGMSHEEMEREFAKAAGLAPAPAKTRAVPVASLHFMGSYLARSGRVVADYTGQGTGSAPGTR